MHFVSVSLFFLSLELTHGKKNSLFSVESPIEKLKLPVKAAKQNIQISQAPLKWNFYFSHIFFITFSVAFIFAYNQFSFFHIFQELQFRDEVKK